MRRKIIKQGHSTLTITLPSKWAKNYNLKAGDEVNLIEKENGLLLTSEKKNEYSKAEFDISGFDIPTIWKYFMAVYREGHDELKVNFKQNEKFDSPYKYFVTHKLDLKYGKEMHKKNPVEFLHDIVSRFIGWEIINYERDYVIVKDMSEPSSKEFDNALRRIFLLIEQMTEEIYEALEKGRAEHLSHIHDIDVNLDKFHDYCIRILNKVGNKDSKKTSLTVSTLLFLELIGDEFKQISHHLLYDFKKSSYKNVIELTQSIKKQFELYYDFFYKFDKEKIIEASNLDKDRYFSVSEQYKKINTEGEREVFHHLRVISRYLNTLSELRIEMEF